MSAITETAERAATAAAAQYLACLPYSLVTVAEAAVNAWDVEWATTFSGVDGTDLDDAADAFVTAFLRAVSS